MGPPSRREFIISEHALTEAQRRSIPLAVLRRVLESPEQIVPAHSGRSAYQAQVELDGVRYLVRAIVEPGDPLTVITVYRTSKIGKYWREDA